MFDLLCKRISEQQEKADLTVRAVGSQLIDICKDLGTEACEIVLQDLEKPEMSITECEKKIKEFADELHKQFKGPSVCVTGIDAENIIKKFYGIDGIANSQSIEKINTNGDFLNLEDFL